MYVFCVHLHGHQRSPETTTIVCHNFVSRSITLSQMTTTKLNQQIMAVNLENVCSKKFIFLASCKVLMGHFSYKIVKSYCIAITFDFIQCD